jgi:hypothetical protein
MLRKVIQITIPEKEEIPEYMNTFSPEENFLMIKIGSQCLKEARVAIAGLSQKEIYEKIQSETKVQREKLELDLLVERETHKKVMDHMEEKIQAIYNESEARLKKRNEKLEEMNQGLREQLKAYELENSAIIQKAILKEKEKCELLLREKDNQNSLNREVFDKAIQLTNKTQSKKGQEGEETFRHYAETFRDFQGFDLIDKHTQGGQGDFHMHFKEFDILVDAKNYKKGVPGIEREKIIGDLKNGHMNFAWLVSLNTNINKFDKAPIMYEWIGTDKCVCYVNNLLQYEDPSKILRIAWFSCKELFKMMEDDSTDTGELTTLRENQYKMNEKIKNMRKIMREITASINVLKKQVDSVDYELRDLLDLETKQLVESNFSLMDNWWNENIIPTNEDAILISTDLWYKFRQDNKSVMKEFDLTPEKFRQFIKTKLPMTSYSIRGKSGEGSYDIKGFKWKEKEEEKLVEEVEEKTKKVVRKKGVKMVEVKTEPLNSSYINEKVDEEVLKMYNEELMDIMEISEKKSLKPWQIISLLMKHKLVNSRTETRGYEKYKDTEEYKEKCSK